MAMNRRGEYVAAAMAAGLAILTAGCGSTTFPSVSISPAAATIPVTGTEQFTATVTGASNPAVNWSVKESGGGTVSAAGLYTPPLKAGKYEVIAALQSDSVFTATAVVTVTAPAPVFSTTASVTAAEGVAYTYTPEVTDPAGTAVACKLTAAPDGAGLVDGVLSWIPSWSESRAPNSFTLTATTAAGGSATQSWSVSPSGTIEGSWIDTYWNASGASAPSPNNLQLSSTTNPQWNGVAAAVPNGDGTFTMIPGVGSTNGTFFISGVPAGNYWLWWNGGTQMFWTSSSTFDYGSDYIGRILSWTNFVSTTLNYNLSGLDPWNGNDSLMLNAPNVNLWENDTQVAPNPGDTAYDQTDPSPVSIQPVAAAWGDVLYVASLSRQP